MKSPKEILQAMVCDAVENFCKKIDKEKIGAYYISGALDCTFINVEMWDGLKSQEMEGLNILFGRGGENISARMFSEKIPKKYLEPEPESSEPKEESIKQDAWAEMPMTKLKNEHPTSSHYVSEGNIDEVEHHDKETYYSDKPVSVPLEHCIVHKDSEITKLEQRIEKLEKNMLSEEQQIKTEARLSILEKHMTGEAIVTNIAENLDYRLKILERENKRLKYAFLEIIRQRFDGCGRDMDDWWQSAELSISNFDLWLDEVEDKAYIWYKEEANDE